VIEGYILPYIFGIYYSRSFTRLNVRKMSVRFTWYRLSNITVYSFQGYFFLIHVTRSKGSFALLSGIIKTK